MNDTVKNVKRSLFVKLSEKEFVERAMELAQVDIDIGKLEGQRKAVAEDFKNQIGGKVARKMELRNIVLDKKEIRSVECLWIPEWHSKSVLLSRMDTHEEVDRRTMTPEELQGSFEYSKDDRQLPEPRDGTVWDADADVEADSTDEGSGEPEEPGEDKGDDDPEFDPETGEVEE